MAGLDDLAEFMADTVTVATSQGAGAYGPSLAAPVTIPGVMISAKRRFVRNSDGNEVISETSILAAETLAPTFTLGSEVTLPNGSTSTVLAVAVDQILFRSLVVNLG